MSNTKDLLILAKAMGEILHIHNDTVYVTRGSLAFKFNPSTEELMNWLVKIVRIDFWNTEISAYHFDTTNVQTYYVEGSGVRQNILDIAIQVAIHINDKSEIK